MTRLLACMLLSLTACMVRPAADVGTRPVEVPRDSTPQCVAQCAQIGLSLDSVVLMAANVGCVCRAAPQPTTMPPGASAAAGGMAAIMLAQEAARRE